MTKTTKTLARGFSIKFFGAGDGNRTRVLGLGNVNSTVRPQNKFSCLKKLYQMKRMIWRSERNGHVPESGGETLVFPVSIPRPSRLLGVCETRVLS